MDVHIATLVVQSAVTKIDALAIIALATDSFVAGAGTVSPSVPLGRNVRVEVEIPKFGEPPPLAIDVVSEIGLGEAQAAARDLRSLLERVTPWRIVEDF
ncbi:hypothetical protein BH11ACT3_BH11ACT3_01240 [soil metagenome]